MKNDFGSLFNSALNIAEKYELDAGNIAAALEEIPGFRVTAPVIGGFSTGKSSLINAVIGEKLLSEAITPETAVPTEITYGNDTVVMVENDGRETSVPLSEFDSKTLAADKYSVVKIGTSNALFAQIPSVRLVDMPGFDSGYEVHNRAIDNYLPKSLAYILTVAADEGTLRESIITFLNELKLYDMPVYTVITKSGKVEESTIEALRSHLSETISRFLKIENPKIAVTNAKGSAKSTDGFRDILLELQANSEEIYNGYFSARLDNECIAIEKYLSDRLSQSDMSLEDIKLQKEQLDNNMRELSKKTEDLKIGFREQISNCISSVQAKIASSLSNNRSSIESLILQGGDVGGRINTIIRSAITEGIQNDVEPKIRSYIKKVSDVVRTDVYADISVNTGDYTAQENQIVTSVNSIVVPVVTTAAATALTAFGGTTLAVKLGLTASVLGPIGAAVGALAGLAVSAGVSSAMRKKKEEERQNAAAQKANEIISAAASDASAKVETEIMNYIDEIDRGIEDEIAQKRSLLEKSLSDTEEKLRLGTAEREAQTAELTADLETIRGIRNGI